MNFCHICYETFDKTLYIAHYHVQGMQKNIQQFEMLAIME